MIQALVNAVGIAGPLVLLALSLWIVFAASRVFHIFHSALFVLCPYIYHLCAGNLDLPNSLALFLSLASTLVLGYAVGTLFNFAQVKLRATGLMLFLASLGSAVVAQNVVAAAFGNQSISFRVGVDSFYEVSSLFVFTRSQFLGLVISSGVVALVAIWSSHTTSGRQLRAMSENRNLAIAIGLPTAKLTKLSWLFGSLLSGLSGLLIANSNGINPSAGISPFFVAIAIMLLAYNAGTGRTIYTGILFASLQELLLWALPGHWGQGALYAILVAVLCFQRSPISLRIQRGD